MNLVLPLLPGGLTILIPLAAILWLLRSRADSRRLLLLRTVQTGGLVTFACLAGAWSYSSWYLPAAGWPGPSRFSESAS